MITKKSNKLFNSLIGFFLHFKLEIVCLLLLFILALLPRMSGFLNTPPSLNWDEMAVGVNGWTIATEGRDEWGNFLPLTFKSFGDDKNPVHIYTTAFFIKLFGLSDFSVRLPVLVLGVLNVLLLFLVAKVLFKSTFVAFVSGVSLAVSPHNLIFSHFNHELNFTIFLFLFGLLFFFFGLGKKSYYLLFGFIFFGISLLSYNSAKVVVPFVVLLLSILFFKKLWLSKSLFISGLLIFFLTVGLVIIHPGLSGLNRAGQTSFSDDDIKQSDYFKKTENVLGARFLLVKDQYFEHFSSSFLFEKGDENVRHSTRIFGLFYQLEAVFMLLGLLMLIILRSKEALLLLVIILLAPIPSALFKESPHSARAMFLTGSLHMLVGLGSFFVIRLLYFFNNKVGKRYFSGRIAALLILFPIVGYYLYQVQIFNRYYTEEYPKKYAIDWQYGMKDVVTYIRSRTDLQRVYITDSRSQPYIFFRFYEPIGNEQFFENVVLDDSQWRLSNTVEVYDKYIFGRWDKLESMPTAKTLYVLTPSEYSGLKHLAEFEVKKLVHFPDGGDAFFIVEGRN